MKRAIVIFILTFMCMSAMAQQWLVSPHYRQADGVYIRYGNGGHSDLTKALDSIAPHKTLVSINMGRLIHLDSGGFQKDILTYLQTHNPEELKAALASAGNMHNPNVVVLRKPFRDAVLNTKYINNINRSLRDHEYQIQDISFEKFFVIKEPGAIIFDAMTWLKVEKSPNNTPINVDQNKRREKRLAALILPSYWRR